MIHNKNNNGSTVDIDGKGNSENKKEIMVKKILRNNRNDNGEDDNDNYDEMMITIVTAIVIMIIMIVIIINETHSYLSLKINGDDDESIINSNRKWYL